MSRYGIVNALNNFIDFLAIKYSQYFHALTQRAGVWIDPPTISSSWCHRLMRPLLQQWPYSVVWYIVMLLAHGTIARVGGSSLDGHTSNINSSSTPHGLHSWPALQVITDRRVICCIFLHWDTHVFYKYIGQQTLTFMCYHPHFFS